MPYARINIGRFAGKIMMMVIALIVMERSAAAQSFGIYEKKMIMESMDSLLAELKTTYEFLDSSGYDSYRTLFSDKGNIFDDLFCEREFPAAAYKNLLRDKLKTWSFNILTVGSDIGESVGKIDTVNRTIPLTLTRIIKGGNEADDSISNLSKITLSVQYDKNSRGRFGYKIINVKGVSSNLLLREGIRHRHYIPRLSISGYNSRISAINFPSSASGISSPVKNEERKSYRIELSLVENNASSQTGRLLPYHSVGLGLFLLRSGFKIDSVLSVQDDVDEHNDNYISSVVGRNLTESVDLLYLELPLRLGVEKRASGQRTGYQVFAGLIPSLNLWNSFSGSGTFTYTAYYPQYDMTLDHEPEMGFGADQKTSSTGQLLRPKRMGLFAELGIGFSRQISARGVFVCIDILYRQSLLDILNGSAVQSVSARQQEYNGMINTSNVFKVNSYGFGISLLYRPVSFWRKPDCK